MGRGVANGALAAVAPPCEALQMRAAALLGSLRMGGWDVGRDTTMYNVFARA